MFHRRLVAAFSSVLTGFLLTSCVGQAEGEANAPLAPVAAHVEATLWTPWVAVSGFAPSEEVTVAYDETNDGTPEWTGSATTSSSGDAPFNLGSIQIKVGAKVTASSATYARELVVEEVRIEYANAASNVVAGVAPPDTEVRVQVWQAGPPLADVVVTSGADGKWSFDFSSTYDIEDGRSLSAQVSDGQGNVSRVGWEAVVPTVGAGYSQYGANSVNVMNFAPGTSVRMQIDFGDDGGPLDGFDYDQTIVVDSRYGSGFDIGGFDLLRPGDRLVATGGGWTKQLVTTLLRIEKADPASDIVGGVAVPSSNVSVAVMPEGGGGPPAAQILVTADATTGWWEADFSALVDFAADRQVMAFVKDEDGDQTTTSWYAVTPYFSALVTDGPPSGVSI